MRTVEHGGDHRVQADFTESMRFYGGIDEFERSRVSLANEFGLRDRIPSRARSARRSHLLPARRDGAD